MDLAVTQGQYVCNGNTDVGYKSVMGPNLCVFVSSDIVGCYCFVMLLGNRRVTLWCNWGYEHIRHSLRPYQKEKRGHQSLQGWGGVSVELYGSRFTVDPQIFCLPTSSQLPHATVSAGATILFHPGQWHPYKFTERSFQLFPVFVGVRPLRSYEWIQEPGVPPHTFIRPKCKWLTQGRKEDKLGC